MAESTSLTNELAKLSRVLSDPSGFYKDIIDASDPRVADWMWMQSPLPTVAMVILYLAFVNIGPRLMKNREPFDMKPLLFVFNSFIVALNFWMAWELTVGMIQANYNWMCTPILYSTDPSQMRIARALWWYYFSKFVEFSDTVFFILRKKDNQVTFLHVYHHASMFTLWWIGVKWVAGGQSSFGAWINCLVHVVMYSYYALSALGPRIQKYLWWKKHITHMQLIQFSIALIHCSHSLYIDCNFPKWMHYTLLGYATSFIILFTNFYIHTYIKKKRRGGVAGRTSSSRLGGKEEQKNGISAHSVVPNGNVSSAKKEN